MLVRKKPIEIRAWRGFELINLAALGLPNLPAEIRQGLADGKLNINPRAIAIKTVEGNLTFCKSTDYLMFGTDGQFYPRTSEAFEDSYEIVEP